MKTLTFSGVLAAGALFAASASAETIGNGSDADTRSYLEQAAVTQSKALAPKSAAHSPPDLVENGYWSGFDSLAP